MDTPIDKTKIVARKYRDRFQGLRVFVHKAERPGKTTISIPHAQVVALLRLAHYDDGELRSCARELSAKVRPEEGQGWSSVVVGAMFARFRAMHIPPLRLEAEEILSRECSNLQKREEQ